MVDGRMREIMACVALGAALTLSGCQNVDSALRQEIVLTTADEYLAQMRSSVVPTVSADATKREGVLTVGLLDSRTAPLVLEVESNQTSDEAASASNSCVVDGLDVDVACELADELGLRVEFVRVSEALSALESSCDIVMGVSPLEANGFVVQGDYAQTSTALYQHGVDTPLATADEVKGARIAVQEGSSSEQTLHRLGLDTKLVPCSSLADTFDALSCGEADYAACSSVAGGYLSMLRGGTSLAGVLEKPTSYGYGVAPNQSELEASLAQAYLRISNNGILAESLRTWLGTTEAIGEDDVIAGISDAGNPAVGAGEVQPAGSEEQGGDVAQENDGSGELNSASDTADGQVTSTEAPNAPSDGTSTETEVIAGSNAATL